MARGWVLRFRDQFGTISRTRERFKSHNRSRARCSVVNGVEEGSLFNFERYRLRCEQSHDHMINHSHMTRNILANCSRVHSSLNRLSNGIVSCSSCHFVQIQSGNSTNVWSTDRRTDESSDGLTNPPTVEMRERF